MMQRGKNTIQIALVTIVAGLLLVLLFNKNKLNGFISGEMQKQAVAEYPFSKDALVDSLYNYTKNGLDYEFTLLEFGTGTCAICKQMEPVLETIQNAKEKKIRVLFVNTMQPSNLPQMKFFGISAVPLQVVLDREGQEIFRHYGFVSAPELMGKFINSVNE